MQLLTPYATVLMQLTPYATLDLASNLIGFYKAVYNYNNRDIERICGAIGVEASYEVWDETGGLGKNRTFDSIDHNDACIECDKPLQWPNELSTIQPNNSYHERAKLNSRTRPVPVYRN